MSFAQWSANGGSCNGLDIVGVTLVMGDVDRLRLSIVFLSTLTRSIVPVPYRANAEANGVDWKGVHSCVRWNKPTEEVAAIILSPAHANCVDTKNGNYPIHIAAQNGHLDLVTWLVTNGAKVNVQNGTGQTPLHMSTSYDYADVADFLRANGADGEICNWDGNPAKFGIDGDKDPSDPMFLFDSCKSTEQALTALEALEAKAAASPGDLDKGTIAMMGMQVKKGNKNLPKEMWTADCQAKFGGVMGML